MSNIEKSRKENLYENTDPTRELKCGSTTAYRGVETIDNLTEYSGLICPFGQHNAGDAEINWHFRMAAEPIKPIEDFEIDRYLWYYLDNHKKRDILDSIAAAMYKNAKTSNKRITDRGVRFHFPNRTVDKLIQVRKQFEKMIDIVAQYIGAPREMSLTSFLTIPITRMISMMSDLLTHNRDWKDKDWEPEYKWLLISDKDYDCEKDGHLPSYINIRINDDNWIKFQAERYQPALVNNTGLRIKGQFLELMRRIVGMPGQFVGVEEWIDELNSPSDLNLRNEADVKEAVFTRFSLLTASIRKAREKILIQPSTNPRVMARHFVIAIFKNVVINTMESAEWQKGLKGALWSTVLVLSQKA